MTISVSEGLILQLDPDFDMVRSGALLKRVRLVW